MVDTNHCARRNDREQLFMLVEIAIAYDPVGIVRGPRLLCGGIAGRNANRGAGVSGRTGAGGGICVCGNPAANRLAQMRSSAVSASKRSRAAQRKQFSNAVQSNETCANCGNHSLTRRLVTRNFGQGESLLLIENIPMQSCSHCGETYFTAETMHEIERVKTHRGTLAKERKIAVAVFA